MSQRSLVELLRSDFPIQLAPMGSVSATARLPLAVARVGGHAMYPGLGLPPQALEPVLDELAGHTEAFGVNFIVPLMDRDSLELAAERAPYVDFFLVEPDPALVAAVRTHDTVCGWQVESAEEARAAEAAGCDVVIGFGPQPPTRWSTGAIEAMPFYAGRSAGAVTAVQPAAEIVQELAAGI